MYNVYEGQFLFVHVNHNAVANNTLKDHPTEPGRLFKQTLPKKYCKFGGKFARFRYTHIVIKFSAAFYKGRIC